VLKTAINKYCNCGLLAGNQTSYDIKAEKYASVTFTIHILRRPLYYVVNLVIPFCLLSVIAVITFFLPSDCSDRLGLST